MKNFKKNGGITLVVLVITIIILLILAGISISALTNQGLFTQAQNAKNLTEEKTAEENEILTNYVEQMNAIIGGQVTESVPDGAIVTPVNDITTWLKTAEISKQYSYTTIEQVIADSTCTQSLMKNENAMKYLARSTEFADAICTSETAMTYLGDSAYVDDTVLNSDVWKNKIKESRYWTLVYASKTVTVYGAASETITIEGYDDSFTTGTNGSCSHVVPIDTITLTGSVSGQSFTRTVTSSTTEVYVMPERCLYWYGNECTNITGGWKLQPSSGYESYTSVQKNATNMYFYLAYANYHGSLVTNKKIDVTGYSKLVFSGNFEFGTGAQTDYTPNVTLGVEYDSVPSSGYYGADYFDDPEVWYMYKQSTINKMILDLSDVTNNLLIPVIHGNCGVLKFTFEGIWLE